MNKSILLATIFLGTFILLFLAMMDGTSIGQWGRVAVIAMAILPAAGIFFSAQAPNSPNKWLLLTLNVLAFVSMILLLILGFEMGEK